MRKITFFLSLVLLILTIVSLGVPQVNLNSLRNPLYKNLAGQQTDGAEKTIKGEISSYLEVHPTISQIVQSNEAVEKVEAEFESVENPQNVVTHNDDDYAGGSVEEYILAEINQYRAGSGLTPVVMNYETCEFAATRARELGSDYSHAGFRARIDSDTLPYPSYGKVTENIAENYSYTEVVGAWIASPSHAENMRADTPYVCVKGYGNHFAYEGWRP